MDSLEVYTLRSVSKGGIYGRHQDFLSDVSDTPIENENRIGSFQEAYRYGFVRVQGGLNGIQKRPNICSLRNARDPNHSMNSRIRNTKQLDQDGTLVIRGNVDIIIVS